jgi:hypothetical protein
MADVSRGLQRFRLVGFLPLFLAASFGGENTGATFRPRASRGAPFRCPSCGWVEWSRQSRPSCIGIAEGSHPMVATERVDESEAGPPTAAPKRFR